MTSLKKYTIVIILVVLIVSGVGLYLCKDTAGVKLVDKENVIQLDLVDFNRSCDYTILLDEYDRIVEYFEKLTILPVLSLPYGGTSYNLKIYYDRGKLQSVGISGEKNIDIDGKHYIILTNKNDNSLSDFIESLAKEVVISE